MAKYKLNPQELLEHWDDQLSFIQSSVKEFDKGKENEARRIATSLRIMFHETASSHSLIKQTNLKYNFPLWSSGGLYTPSNLLSSWVLLEMSMGENGLHYKPLSDTSGRTFFLEYQDWWNEIVFDDKSNVFTRKDIVGYIANQDGGAHVDPNLNEKYAALTKHNSLGWIDGMGNSAKNNPVYNAVRQIAQELIVSQKFYNNGNYTRSKQKDRLFEVRFIDKERRFKWSTTELTYSEETIDIVSQYKKEKRTLYLQKYSDGSKLEFVGQ